MAVLWNYLDRFAPQLALRFMMNRRNIRIKVMQVLYMIETEVQIAPKTLLQKEFDKTRNLFVFLVHLLHQVALYAEVEANQRASKNLPNQEDLTVNTKLAGNLLVWQTLESESFKNALELVKPAQYLDDQIVKSIPTDVRKKLWGMGIKIGRYHIYLPKMLKPKAVEFRIGLWKIFNNQ